jgi:RNA polymerase sigma-70 factor (ECF subfamily)
MNESNSPGQENQLVAKARSGDLESFEALVKLYEKRIFHIAYKIVESLHEAEDVLQEAFLKAFENLAKFRGESSFYTWIVQIAVNAALQRVKKRRRPQTVALDELNGDTDDFRPEQIVAWDENPEELYSRKETQHILEEAIARLPTLYRTVFLLKDVENMPMEEIARILEISLPAAKSRLIRGRLELRETLSPYFKKKGAPVYSGAHQHDR